MKVDAELMFDCLLYINGFYYVLLFPCDSIMSTAKYFSAVLTPDIMFDACITFTMLIIEFLKLILFKKYRDTHRGIISFFVILMNFGTLGCDSYKLFVQDPVLKLEKLLAYLMTTLAITEIVFGSLQLCIKKKPYYV